MSRDSPPATVTVTAAPERETAAASMEPTADPPVSNPPEPSGDGGSLLRDVFPEWAVDYVAPPAGETTAVSAWYGHDPSPIYELSGAVAFAFTYASNEAPRTPQEESYLSNTLGNIVYQFPAAPFVQLACDGGTVLIINADAAESKRRTLENDYGCQRY